jgi:tetratricopeptide (TPR) repeat protein
MKSVESIDSSSGFQVWADDFVGELKDVFSLQEQTALKIAQALNLHLSPQEQKAVEKRYTQNPQAYEAFLVGCVLLSAETPEKLEAARKYFEQALKLDPEYAPALAGLCNIEIFYYRDIDPNASHLLRAIAVAPALAEGHVALGQTYVVQYDYARAAGEFREAIRLEPENGFAWDQLSWALCYEQPPDLQEVEKAAREAIRLLPALPQGQYHLGRALLLQERYQEAAAAFRHSGELGAPSLERFGLAQVSLAQGNYDQASAYLLDASSSKTAISLYWQSAVYAGKGNKERALATLRRSLDAGFRDFPAIEANPYFSSLRNDPRFNDLVHHRE